MMKASPMTTKMVAALITAIINQWRYYNHTGYKIVALKFIAEERQLKKNSLSFKP